MARLVSLLCEVLPEELLKPKESKEVEAEVASPPVPLRAVVDVWSTELTNG